ncbi:O-antigen ligase family protein [Shewanella sp. 125m-7]
MSHINSNPFFCSPPIETIFKTLLISITIAITLMGGAAPFIVAFTVAKFELIFIGLYLFLRITHYQKQSIHQPIAIAPKVAIIGVLMLISLIASTLLNYPDKANDIQYTIVNFSVLFTAIHLLFFATLAYSQIQYRYSVLCCFKAIPATIFFIAIILVIMQLTGYPSSLYENTLSVPFASNIRYLGYLCCASTSILSVYLLQQRNHSANMTILSIVFMSNLALLIWLGGRGSLIAYFSTVSIYIAYLLYQRQLVLKYLVLLLILIISSIFLADWVSIFNWNGPGRFFTSIEVNNVEEGLNKLSSNRIAIWTQTINAITETPWFGLGPEGYRFHPEHVFGLQPHNVILQMLITYGVVGGALIAYLYYSMIQTAMKQVSDKTSGSNLESTMALIVIVSLSIHGLVDGTFYHAQPLYYLILSVAVLVAGAQADKVITSKTTVSKVVATEV